MPGQYTLDAKNQPVPEPDLMKWAKWMERADRIVAKTVVNETTISTVFLGVDHSFGVSVTPILYETMAFQGGDALDEMERYTTRAKALAGHKRWVKVRKAP